MKMSYQTEILALNKMLDNDIEETDHYLELHSKILNDIDSAFEKQCEEVDLYNLTLDNL